MKNMLIINLNGINFGLLEQLAKNGIMPKSADILSSGNCGILDCGFPVLDTTSFASFLTGLLPSEHKILGLFKPDRNNMPSAEMVNSKSVAAKTLLEILSENNKKIISVYIPLTHPAKPINGLMVTDTIFRTDKTMSTYPAGLKKTLLRQIGEPMLPKAEQFFPVGGFKNKEDVEIFIEKQSRSITKTRDISLLAMKTLQADAVFVQFYATDTLQHALWHYIDTSHPGFINDTKIQSLIYGFFTILDNCIKSLIEHYKPSSVLLFSNHGFVPCVKILNLKRCLKDFDGPRKAGADLKTIYLNKKTADSAYAENLKKYLESVTDDKTGKKVVREVKNIASVLALDLESGYSCRPGLENGPLFTPCAADKDYLSGTHTEKGLWAVTGIPLQNKTAHITDLAPMILSYFGITRPGYMNGNSLI